MTLPSRYAHLQIRAGKCFNRNIETGVLHGVGLRNTLEPDPDNTGVGSFRSRSGHLPRIAAQSPVSFSWKQGETMSAASASSTIRFIRFLAAQVAEFIAASLARIAACGMLRSVRCTCLSSQRMGADRLQPDTRQTPRPSCASRTRSKSQPRDHHGGGPWRGEGRLSARASRSGTLDGAPLRRRRFRLPW